MSNLKAILGLVSGQSRSFDRRVENGVWFDIHWKMIGWGDLADDDFVRIAKAIPFGNLFLVVDSRQQPIAHDIDSCIWMIERGCIYKVLRFIDHPETFNQRIGNVRFRRIISSTARQIIERINRVNT